MSYKKTPNKNKKTSNNVKNKTKKKKLNYKKLVIVLLAITMILGAINVAAIGVSKIYKNISIAVEEKEEKEKQAQEEKAKIEREEKEKQDERERQEIVKKKYTVLIDPGHGGVDTGNKGFSHKDNEQSKVLEKEISLKVSKKIVAILSKEEDIQVVLTRSDDKTIETQERVEMANSQKIDALVSIHMNAEASGNTAKGIETYYRTNTAEDDKSYQLSSTIQSTIASYVDMKNRGVKQQDIKVLIDTKMPAALVECGFITNEEEEKNLLDEQYQNQLAEGIAQGILTFLDEYIKE